MDKAEAFVLPKRRFLKKGKQYIMRATRLPHLWFMNDFSPTENLIEIEDRAKGDRFWVVPGDLFWRILLSVGCKIQMTADWQNFICLKLTEFSPYEFRGREYVAAIFELSTDGDTPYTLADYIADYKRRFNHPDVVINT